MNKNKNGGYSLIETLIAITVLAIIVIPTCSSLVMSHRLNAKTDEMMQAQLAVSSAVEMLMAAGIPSGTSNGEYGSDRFPEVDIEVTKNGAYYNVKVISEDGSVTVTTTIRAVDIGGGAGT